MWRIHSGATQKEFLPFFFFSRSIIFYKNKSAKAGALTEDMNH